MGEWPGFLCLRIFVPALVVSMHNLVRAAMQVPVRTQLSCHHTASGLLPERQAQQQQSRRASMTSQRTEQMKVTERYAAPN